MNSHGEALAYCSAVPFALMTGDNDDAIVVVWHALVPALRAHEIRPADIAATCGGGLSPPPQKSPGRVPGDEPSFPWAEWSRSAGLIRSHRDACGNLHDCRDETERGSTQCAHETESPLGRNRPGLSRGAGHRPATRAPSASRSALSERCIFSETRYACLYGCTMNVSPAQRIILIERTRRGRARKASGGTRQTRWEAGRGVRLTR